jgi:tetratricopeptide (TPR) repeat protein
VAALLPAPAHAYISLREKKPTRGVQDWCDSGDDYARSPLTWGLAIMYYELAIAEVKRGAFAPEAHAGRGNVWWQRKDHARALADYQEAVRQVQGDRFFRSSGRAARLYLHLAAAYAAYPDAKVRSPAKALTLAEKACEATRYRDADSMQVLAALHAQAGDFVAAARWQARALDLLGPKDRMKKRDLPPYDPEQEKAAKARLEQYRQERTAWDFDWYVTGAAVPEVGKAER